MDQNVAGVQVSVDEAKGFGALTQLGHHLSRLPRYRLKEIMVGLWYQGPYLCSAEGKAGMVSE